MNESTSPFSGKKCVIATMHGKENALQARFKSELGMQLILPDSIDTDSLGTFTGEVPRRQRSIDTAIRKTELGMKLTGIKRGVATEGTFGPDPALPFMKLHSETIVFVDDSLGISVYETAHSYNTPFDSFTCTGFEQIREEIDSTGFPGQAMTVRPEKTGWISKVCKRFQVYKGITDYDHLEIAIDRCCKVSRTGKAVVETDMRAHMNPTRMDFIKELGGRLAERLKNRCPNCKTPGWGVMYKKSGLPCEFCHLPTDMILYEVWVCLACKHTVERERDDNLKYADATFCANCNP